MTSVRENIYKPCSWCGGLPFVSPTARACSFCGEDFEQYRYPMSDVTLETRLVLATLRRIATALEQAS